jgi:molybdopterin molybdotransferase
MKFKPALNKILEYTVALDKEEKDLNEVLGRILFNDIYAPIDLPSVSRSAMDGYAICIDDIDTLPKTFDIQGRIGVDEMGFKLKKNHTFWVNTGSPLPEGANCVIEVEKAKIKEDAIQIFNKPDMFYNVTRKSAEIKKGIKILNKGEIINVRRWALLAHCGITNVFVFKKPKVAVFTTGNEVITPYDMYKEGKVYNTNRYILKGLVEKWGAEFFYMHLKDDIRDIKQSLNKALSSFDIIVTTGGISRGKTDFTKKAMEECGINIIFSKPNVKPGRPFTFGIEDKTLIFAFSGPPAAMFMTAYAFLKPALFKMSGREDYIEKLFNCKLLEDMHSKKGKLYLNRVKFIDEELKVSVKSSGSQKSDNFLSVVNADGFIMIDENKDDVGKFSVFKGGRFDD